MSDRREGGAHAGKTDQRQCRAQGGGEERGEGRRQIGTGSSCFRVEVPPPPLGGPRQGQAGQHEPRAEVTLPAEKEGFQSGDEGTEEKHRHSRNSRPGQQGLH